MTGWSDEGKTVQQVYEESVRAYYRGDLESAKAGLERVTTADPRHSLAQAYLARVTYQLKSREASGVGMMQRQLAEVIIPSVDFKEATLESVIEYIQEKTAELTEKKVQPSIVFKGDGEYLQQKKLTLKLTNVPVTEVLRYVGELANVQFKYEKYAILATPVGVLPVAEVSGAVENESATISADGADPLD